MMFWDIVFFASVVIASYNLWLATGNINLTGALLSSLIAVFAAIQTLWEGSK